MAKALLDDGTEFLDTFISHLIMFQINRCTTYQMSLRKLSLRGGKRTILGEVEDVSSHFLDQWSPM